MTVDYLLTRTLNVRPNPLRGEDVDGVKRTVYRGLDRRDQGGRLKKHNGARDSVRETFGPFFAQSVRALKKADGMPVNGKVAPEDFAHWRAKAYPDDYAISLLRGYKADHTVPPLVWPLVSGAGDVCQGLHETAGIPGNWAIDFCAEPGTKIVAVEAGTVTKLSGHSPADDTADANGVYGWSLHFKTPTGYEYFVTHEGTRTVYEGEHLVAGTVLGTVGNQRYRPDHCHYGCSSARGEVDARNRMRQIAALRDV